MRKQIFTVIVLALFIIIGGHTAAQQAKPFTLKLGAVRGGIQWEQSFDRSVWTNIGGGNVDSLQVQATKTTYYRAKITEAGCSPVYSDVKAAFQYGDTLIPARLIKGQLVLPSNTTIGPGLKVYSALGNEGIKNDRTFEILVPDSSEQNTLLIVNSEDSVLMLGHFFQKEENYIINVESTALGILHIYPVLKPITNDQKASLAKLYKNEPEFQLLTAQIESLIKANKNLFSESNSNLIAILKTLITKPFNQDRLRIANTQISEPIYIRGGGNSPSTVYINNTASFSYRGQIYKMDKSEVNVSFNLPGAIIRSSSFASQLFSSWVDNSVNISKSELAFDLRNEYHLPSGEYEILLQSGLANDGSDLNKEALLQNFSELLILSLSSFVEVPGLFESECARRQFTYLMSTVNVYNLYDAIQGGTNMSLFADYIKNYLVQLENLLFKDCDIFNKRSTSFFKLFKVLNLVDKFSPPVYFTGDWLISPKKINACQYLDAEFNTSPCFTIKPYKIQGKDYIGNEKFYTGDTVELKVISRLNEDYYLNSAVADAGFKYFSWLTPDGVFAPDDAVNAPDRTAVDGIAKIKWVMPCVEKDNGVFINIPGIPKSLTEKAFTAKSYHPNTQIVQNGNNQTTTPSKRLPEKLRIQYLDKLDGLPLFPTRFNIQWQKIKGSGTIDAAFSTQLDSSFYWTLGPEAGEQVMQATITSKNCDWPIDNNVILFKANKPVQKSVSIVSGNNQEGAPNIYLSDFLVVKVLDESGNPISGVTVEWSIISGGGSLETLTAVTDNDGLAKTKWKLGSTGAQQARAIVKKPDGTNVDGSPAIFNASLLLQKTVSLVSGDNQGGGPDSYLADFLIVKVSDENNNPVSGTTVQWSVEFGGGSVENSSTLTDNNGLAKTKWKLGLSGDQQVKATVKKADGSDITGSPVVFNAGFAIITTIAGNGTIGYSGDGGDALNASINPSNICVDKNGNVFFAENTRIRKVNMQTGIITTVAGNGRMPAGNNGAPNHIFVVSDGAPATADSILTTELCVDNSGNLYFGSSRRIRKVNATTGIISTILGPGIADSLGNYPLVGRADSVYVGQVRSLVFDEQGNLFYVAHDRVFKLSAATNRVSIYAGNGQGNTGDGGPATAASFYKFGILSTDKLGNLYIVDEFYSVVRKVTASTGIVSKVAGIGIGNYSGDGGPAVNAALATPTSVAIDSDGNVLISDYGNYRIRRVNATTGIISTVIGTGQNSFSGDGGNPAQATLAGPRGVYIDKDGYIYISDWGNARIRRAKLFK
jgi:streptogramin lyase